MVKVSIGRADPAAAKADLLAVSAFQGEDKFAGKAPAAAARSLNALVDGAGFGGGEGKVLALDAPAGFAARRILLVGLGRRKDLPVTEAARRAAATAFRRSSEHGARSVALLPPDDSADVAAASAEGLLLADYSFDRHKTGNKPTGRTDLKASILVGDDTRAGARRQVKLAEATCAGVALARDLGNEPSNVLTPAALAAEAQRIVRRRPRSGLSCKVMDKKEIERRKMGAFLAVNQGSVRPPRFIHLKYRPPGTPSGRKMRRVALVGKGLTFDSGGISIKPSANMEDMKYDMCGSATVLGVFSCLPDLGLKQEVHGFIAATDNMPSGSAIKPGDVVTSMPGKTIEIINTDAEGRLTLVDAITYALETKPDVVVDLATLTGACAIALGSAAGVMSNSTALRAALCAAATEVGERAWPLPLFSDYKSQIKSDFADVKNVGERYGGALTAGLFIQEWVPEGLPWAHLDIAGSAWAKAPHPLGPKGATGWGVRALARWLRNLGK